MFVVSFTAFAFELGARASFSQGTEAISAFRNEHLAWLTLDLQVHFKVTVKVGNPGRCSAWCSYSSGVSAGPLLGSGVA